MLTLQNVNAGYGKLGILWEVSMEIKKGEFVALLGPNGAGKTTTLRAISGLLKPTKGEIFFKDEKISGLSVQQIMKKGISFITDDGYLFSGMSIHDNLMMGAYTIKDKELIKKTYEEVLVMFPRLKERLKQNAGTLSGGERKMLAIARGLMSNPMMMLVDEPSLGLAPNLVLQVLETLRDLSRKGVTVLLVEQNVNTTLQLVDRAYVLEHGHIVMEGQSESLLNDAHIKESYLGI